ncbi:MAG TPA: SDR family NAD(P)-dependent oxidoreductase [Puia sp.]|nr:SDR family NAD(P)-dependent oxidoreductase [Puia sp.]
MKKSNDEWQQNSRRNFMKQAAAFTSVAAVVGLSPLMAFSSTTGQTEESVQSKKKKDRKVAVVTGAARGIGRSVSVALAKEGIDIFGIDIIGVVSPLAEYPSSTEPDLMETKRQVEALGSAFRFAKADIRNYQQMEETAKQAQAWKGRIDIVAAVAGVQLFKPFELTDDRHWQDTIENNVLGTAFTLRVFAPYMIQQGGGAMVAISSTQGMHGLRHGAAYSASKWAIVGIAKSAAIDLGAHNIRVNVVVPGLIDTPMTRNDRRWREAMGPGFENTILTEKLVSTTLAERDVLHLPWLSPDDIAPAVVFLTSDAAKKITGAVYDVTGGTSTTYTS